MTSITGQAIKAALSAPRLGTFEAECTDQGSGLQEALALYAWNAQVSAAMLAPLHICEVVVRNAVSDALTLVYGEQWPWSRGLETSLVSPSKGFNPRRELDRARTNKATTGKVIAELKMNFWETMFTTRHDQRLWNRHLLGVLPHLDRSTPINVLRGRIAEDLKQLRLLRNRIAHHEPIFKRTLADDFAKIQELIGFRCPTTSAWMVEHQQAQALIASKP